MILDDFFIKGSILSKTISDRALTIFLMNELKNFIDERLW